MEDLEKKNYALVLIARAREVFPGLRVWIGGESPQELQTIVSLIEAGDEGVIKEVSALTGLGQLLSKPALGKRYRCHICGTEILCMKAGQSHAYCCGQPMISVEPRPLPSSD